MTSTTPQPLPEGYDPADYIAVKRDRSTSLRGYFKFNNNDGNMGKFIRADYAFAVPVPAPTPPAWADVPPEGVWHATGQAIVDNRLDWAITINDIDGKYRDAADPGRLYYAREPQRTAATILDEIERETPQGISYDRFRDLMAEYRAALTAEAGQ